MITVHKYPVQMLEDFSVRMPFGAEVIHVAMQHGQPFMWARVDTDQHEVSYDFGVFGTGHKMTGFPVAEAPHLGSFMMHNENLVFHLFGGIRV
uniref:DUF7352 domain-containing protein n=1 Tax=Pseudomonas phage Nican01 TaxID=3138540 RepID=A0AAU6W0F6_9CAUD